MSGQGLALALELTTLLLLWRALELAPPTPAAAAAHVWRRRLGLELALAVASGPSSGSARRPPRRPGQPAPSSRQRARRTAHWRGDLDHFEAFCRKAIKLDSGKPFAVEGFQRTILRDYFNGARETLVLIPKKNGKTTLMAALLLYHLCYVDSANAFIAAASAKQAGICYKQAQGFILRSPALQRRLILRPGTKEIRCRRDDGFGQVLASDSDTADGVIPTLAIVDELHRHKSTALYDVFADGIDARDGAVLTITTAGDDEEGPLGLMREAYLALPGIQRTGRYTYARSRDGLSVMHQWALEPGDDVEDLDLVKSVNPLRSMTRAKLANRRNSTSMTLPRWRRFACNVWAQGEDAAVGEADWKAIARAGARIAEGILADVVIGIDLGWTEDTTAIVPVGFDPDNRDVAIVDERLTIIPAPGDGSMTDEDLIKDRLEELGHWETGLWPRARFALDPNAGGQHLAQWIIRELCNGDASRVVTVSQQPASMQTVSMLLAEGIRLGAQGKPPVEAGEVNDDDDERLTRVVPLVQPDHPDLNRQMRAAVARWNGERWRFDKRRKARAASTQVGARPIDSVIGAGLGYFALMAPVEASPAPFVIVC